MDTKRIGSIDELRGIAIILVLAQHIVTVVARHPGSSEGFRYWVDIFTYLYLSPGRLGVVLFFLVSGYLIPHVADRCKTAAEFIVARFFRIYPPYVASVILGFVVLHGLGVYNISRITFFANIFMVQSFLKLKDVLPVYWTLKIEIIFYSICLISPLFKRRLDEKFCFIFIIILMASAVFSASIRYFSINYILPVGYLIFLAVCFLGNIYRISISKSGTPFTLIPVLSVFLIVMGTLLASWLAYSQEPDVDSWKAAFTGVVIPVVIFPIYVMRTSLSLSRLAWVGGLSYSLYLVHDIPLQISRMLSIHLPWWLAAIFVPVATVTASLGLAIALYKGVERKSIMISKRSSLRAR